MSGPTPTDATPGATADFSSIRVVVVAHGPPLKGGITTVAMNLVEDPVLNSQFEIVFHNTSQNEGARGKLSLANVRRLFDDSIGTFRLARRGGIVHSHSVQEPWPVAWRQVGIAAAARLRGSAIVLHNHAAAPYMAPSGTYRPSLLNRLGFRVLDRLADANILLSAHGEANMRRYFPTADLPAVANSVVVADLTPSEPHQPPVVLFIGELLARKGLRTLLDALDLVDERGEVAYELRILGNDQLGLDPDKDEMITEVRSRDRGESLLGAVSSTEVYRHLSESDVYVLPTDYEGQPFAVIEALAAGVPIVATRIPSIAAMYDDPTNGRLVERTDTAGFAEALEQLLADPAARAGIGVRNRQLALERFDRSVFRESMARIYRRYGRSA